MRFVAYLVVGLSGCGGTEIVGLRKNRTWVEGTVVERHDRVLVVQAPFFSPDVEKHPPPPVWVSVDDLRAIRIDRPGAVSFAIGGLSTLVALGIVSVSVSNDTDGEPSADQSGGILAVPFFGVGLWQIISGFMTLDDADELLGPALDLPDLPPRFRPR